MYKFGARYRFINQTTRDELLTFVSERMSSNELYTLSNKGNNLCLFKSIPAALTYTGRKINECVLWVYDTSSKHNCCANDSKFFQIFLTVQHHSMLSLILKLYWSQMILLLTKYHLLVLLVRTQFLDF